MGAEESKLEFFETGAKTALICDDSPSAEAVKTILSDLGYRFHIAENGERAIERMTYTQYNVVVVHENFAGSTLASNPVLGYLMPLPMGLRRYTFVCLIGPSFKTLDAMQAFAQSVHVVVNPRDASNLKAILAKNLAEFELFYRVYKESLAAMGER